MKASLYAITEELQEVLAAWEETPEAERTDELEAWFLGLATEKVEERDQKLENYFCLVEEIRAIAQLRKAEGQRLLELAKRDETRATALLERVQQYFEANQIKRVDTVKFPIRLVGNGGQLPLVMESDTLELSTLDDRFIRVSREVDAKAVRQALESGETLAFARLGNRGKHLEWKGRGVKAVTNGVAPAL